MITAVRYQNGKQGKLFNAGIESEHGINSFKPEVVDALPTISFVLSLRFSCKVATTNAQVSSPKSGSREREREREREKTHANEASEAAVEQFLGTHHG